MKNIKKGIVLKNNSIVNTFLYENRKNIELIKTCKEYEIYKLKNTDIYIYISDVENNESVFNTQIIKNLYINNNLNNSIIELLVNNKVFM
jgi:hypothetical protein